MASKLSRKGWAAISLNSMAGKATLKLNIPTASIAVAGIHFCFAAAKPKATTAKIGRQRARKASTAA